MIRENIRELLLIATILIFVALMFTFRENEELRTLLIFAFYFAVSLIYSLDSRYPIVAAIVLLISAAIFLPKDEAFANKLAIYAYYFLVVGVALQLVEYIREQRKEEKETELTDLNISGKCIAIASGKGGVGKTTIATNLALAFAKLGRKCLLVDFDLSMPSVDIAMGLKHEKSLRDALFNNIKIEECIYTVNGCDVIPSSPIPTFFKNGENIKRLKILIDSIKEKYEIILMDFPPGSNVELLDEFKDISLILVANPDRPSLVNLYNIKVLAQERGCEVIGLVLNKAHGDIDIDNIEETLEIHVIAVLPEDNKVKESFNEGVPVVVMDEDREFSREIVDLAKFLLKYLKK